MTRLYTLHVPSPNCLHNDLPTRNNKSVNLPTEFTDGSVSEQEFPIIMGRIYTWKGISKALLKFIESKFCDKTTEGLEGLHPHPLLATPLIMNKLHNTTWT